MDSDSQKEKADAGANKDPDYVLNSHTSSSDDDEKLLTLPPHVAKKVTVVAKSTPPSSVTCANTYFRVILNVCMCEQTIITKLHTGATKSQ